MSQTVKRRRRGIYKYASLYAKACRSGKCLIIFKERDASPTDHLFVCEKNFDEKKGLLEYKGYIIVALYHPKKDYLSQSLNCDLAGFEE